MKKGLLLAAALVLVATSAMASSVVNSAHNLNNIATITNPSGEVCVFCHTPHNAIANNNAPLWNRTLGTTTFNYYNSATLSSFSKGPIVSGPIAGSDAPLCLSCHDGASIANGLYNEPNAGNIGLGGYTMNANANIGGATQDDLSNDHPIGMDYDAVQTATGPGSDEGGFVAFATVSASLNFYNGTMWCSTCHDVHDDVNTPFLATTNVASGLCVTCHIK